MFKDVLYKIIRCKIKHENVNCESMKEKFFTASDSATVCGAQWTFSEQRDDILFMK